ncbi:SpvB/TcaC N-terminal domain-containing protein [Chitinophaga arvensicola]|uniref:RHS repeat-associated core domain-containing protein n=1 Tax=Chitinophaga arvensicola TaxID=29529 RepID=A0A1I0S9M2_9BACT|nr:SpvB/TcaC N-terminal domain-containing protein [Chitinophaga arvensicola]SEW52795.1 RHS repeat-associated core domain-containing protein [Chitinophaga arvensicola]
MKTTDSPSELSGIVVPQITLPKGGGAISGISNTFQPDAFSGTGSYTIPLPVTPARGFEPSLSLSYNSGQGNSAFGLGFSLTLSSITRTTNKGIPRYMGTDIYALTGEGELVKTTERVAQLNGESWLVTAYLPRVQGSYACIEQWVSEKDHTSWWRVISMNNTTTDFGTASNSRITHPADHTQIFQWFPDTSTDAKGNKIAYTYKAENDHNVPPAIYEVNRSYEANRYPQSVKYGNYTDSKGNAQYAFEMIFDYGEYDLSDLHQKNADPYTPVREWAYRPDAFSSYKSGFEIRTCRLCQQVLLFHHFEELGTPCLVKSIALTYDALQHYQPVQIVTMSLLKNVASTGYRKNDDGSYDSKTSPALALDYTPFNVPESPVFEVLEMDGNTIPGYLGEQGFLPVDLNGEGLPGFLFSNEYITTYLAPQGDGKYKLPESPAPFPIERNLQDNNAYLVDLDGNGQLELLAGRGFYQYNNDGSWSSFQSFPYNAVDSSNPFLEVTDMNADGRSDLLLATGEEILIYASAGKEGFRQGSITQNENGIPVKAADPSGQLVAFTDMFGDGLSHRVCISSGLVECWPCLGYGRYGKKITFGNAPELGIELDNSRLFLADIDGSGTTDLVYVSSHTVTIYINQNGNSFSPPIVVNLPFQYGLSDQIHFMDVKGNGTSCLVFSKMLPVPVHYYYDFVSDGMKPYLLNQISNNMGAVISIRYCSSTKFIMEDKRAGRPWVTRLRFPVQVVEKMTVNDVLSGTKTVNSYKYHDGYYDPVDREFRGFGFVESWDTETLLEYTQSTDNPDFPVNRLNKELYVPPVYTKTWCHTGAFLENEAIIRQYQQEYFQGDPQALNFPPSVFDPAIYEADAATLRQAYAALQGFVMHKEVYANDDQPASVNPYTVDASNVTVLLIQPKGDQPYASFAVQSRESISYNYEREPLDPAITQDFTLEVDPLCGSVLLSCKVYLPRRSGPFADSHVYSEQQQLKVTAQRNSYINTTSQQPYRWRGVLYQQEQFEIIHPTLSGAYFTYDTIKTQVNTALEQIIPYLAIPAPQILQAQQLTIGQAYFWNEAQDAMLPLGQLSSRSLIHHQQNAVFTAANISYLFGENMTADIIRDAGGYYLDTTTGYWFNRGLVQHYNNTAASFYQLSKTENSFADPSSSLFKKSTFSYDPYYFLVTDCKEYLDAGNVNETTAVCDYQAMKLRQMVDINGNVTQVLYDPLGNVVVSALFGSEEGVHTGAMRLYEYLSEPAEYVVRTTNKDSGPITFDDVINDPAYYLQGAATYFFYDLDAYQRDNQPVNNITLTRTDFYHINGGTSTFACQQMIQYSDGQGRSIESKQLAAGNKWQASGRVVYNNKGGVAELYLPYYSDSPHYESQQDLVKEFVPPPTITQYDALGRPIRTDFPKGFYSSIVYTPWEEKAYDPDDTVITSPYYISFMANYPANPTQEQINEKDALQKAAAFFNTPAIQIRDNTGSVFLKIQDNLGYVANTAFAAIVQGSAVTSQQVWDELVLKQYLSADGYVTVKFQPYERGFVLQLGTAFNNFIPQITALLKQNCVTAYYATDISSRITTVIDARLYYSNVTKATNYYNFRYGYMMGEQDAILTDSIDAGKPYNLNNIFGNLVWSWSPRNYNQLISYDRLQRRIALRVKQMLPADKVELADQYPLAEVFTYGETQPDAAAKNLRGKIYQLNDLAGIGTRYVYNIQGNSLKDSRQLTEDYKLPPDWNNPASVPLAPEIYDMVFSYNALGQALTQQTPDSTITTTGYDVQGLVNAVTVTYEDKTTQPVVTQIDYDANGQRTKVYYANGVRTAFTYEDTTSRLLLMKSTRQNNDVLQQIGYTYDPVGNITRMTDASIDIVFSNNQKVEPVSDYTYDALYRLIIANGRQHPGITATTYRNNVADGDFKQSKFSQLPADQSGLENYREQYSYDDAFNLVSTRHTAVSSSWTRDTPVEDNSNRLQGLTYDASGNLRQLLINNAVPLSYNCCENLVKAGVIERPQEPDDSDYYNYGSDEIRVRKVCELVAHGGGSVSITEKVYLGNYEIKYEKAGGATTLNRQTLRVMDGGNCVLIIQYWKQDDNKKEAAPGTRQLRWQLSNLLHSVSMEVDTTAQLISYEEYFPYGGTSIIAGSSQVEVSRKDYRYAGKECDDSTGLYYYGARYYVSWQGRWLKPDPAGPVDGINLYFFSGDNPVTFTDPTGNSREVAVTPRVRQRLEDAQGAITYARNNVPYAGNVSNDVVTTRAESTARFNVSRDILRTTFLDAEGTSATDAFNRASSAIAAHGGACNEFSALTHSYLISRPTTEPVIRLWDATAHHSFTLIGDPRALPESELVIADAWPSQYQASTYADMGWSHTFSPATLSITTETPPVSAQQAALNAQTFTAAYARIPAVGQAGGGLPAYTPTSTAGRDDPRGTLAAGETYDQYYNRTLTWNGLFGNTHSTAQRVPHFYYSEAAVGTGIFLVPGVESTNVTRTYHTGHVSNYLGLWFH